MFVNGAGPGNGGGRITFSRPMKILSFTAGAADMYCGSCLRDNALATALLAQGHDITLVPLYTPTLTDEANVSQRRVFFGGISVFLEELSPLFRWTPRFLDKLWDSFAVLKWAARGSISTSASSLAEMTISMLRGEDGRQRKEFAKLTDWLVTQPKPDIVSLPTSLLIALAKPLRQALGRPVLCTLQGEDIFIEGLQQAFQKEKQPRDFRKEVRERIAALAQHVDAFIAVSSYYADFMAGYLTIPREKIHVVPLGINLAGHDPQPRPRSAEFRIGYLARIAPEKGLSLLCEAYVELRRHRGMPPARLEAAGYLGGDAANRRYLESCHAILEREGLAGEFLYHGTLDRAAKLRFLQSVDVLCVPCPYPEPKGFPVLEAMANGVPVVQPKTGAFPEIIEKTGGGLLVEPDAAHFAEGLVKIWTEPDLAGQLSSRAAEGVRRHYSVASMASRTVEVYEEVLQRERKEARR